MLYVSLPEVETMPDRNDDDDNLVPFRLRKKSEKNERKRQTDLGADLPPLKWSSLKYVFRMEDRIDGKEEAYG